MIVAMAATTTLVVAPVVVANWRVTGLPMVQAYGGLNIYLGNRPSGDGLANARLGGEWDALEGEASRAGTDRNGQDRYYLRKTFSEITADPAAYGQLVASKLVWALQDEELRDTHSYYFFEAALPMLRWLPGFGLVFALAVGGAITIRGPNMVLMLAYLAMMLMTVIFLVAGTRYRMPIVPAAIALAGAGVAVLIDRAQSRDWRAAATLMLVATLGLAAGNARTHAASRNLAEEHAFTGLSLLQEKRLEAAEAAYRTAIGLDDSSFAWDGLGLVLLRRELRNDARDAFLRAVRINDRNATAWLHLGFSEEVLNNPRGAIAAYEKALSITPQRREVQDALNRARQRYAR
jgi:tetratricopeptide (TPR) repeat protein